MAADSRHDRHRMRQRGAGARLVNTQFGFTLSLPTSASSSSLPSLSPNQRASHAKSPSPQPQPQPQPAIPSTRRNAANPTRKRKPQPAQTPASEFDIKPRRRGRPAKPAACRLADDVLPSRPPPRKKAKPRDPLSMQLTQHSQPLIDIPDATHHSASSESQASPIPAGIIIPKRRAPKHPAIKNSPNAAAQSERAPNRNISVDQLHAPEKITAAPTTRPPARKTKRSLCAENLPASEPNEPPKHLGKRPSNPAGEPPAHQQQPLSLRPSNLPDPLPPKQRPNAKRKSKHISSARPRPHALDSQDDWQKEDWFQASVPASLLQLQAGGTSRFKFRF